METKILNNGDIVILKNALGKKTIFKVLVERKIQNGMVEIIQCFKIKGYNNAKDKYNSII